MSVSKKPRKPKGVNTTTDEYGHSWWWDANRDWRYCNYCHCSNRDAKASLKCSIGGPLKEISEGLDRLAAMGKGEPTNTPPCADPYIEYWRALNDGAGPRIVGSPQGNVLTSGWGTDAAAQKICNAHNSAIDRLRAENATLKSSYEATIKAADKMRDELREVKNGNYRRIEIDAALNAYADSTDVARYGVSMKEKAKP